MTLLLRVLALLVVGYATLCLLVFLLQARLVYFPGPAPRATPSERGLEHRELELATGDGERLHGWFLPREGARGAVLVCHGNAGSIEQRIELARAFHELGWAVLLFDYRGYGNSTGKPSEEGTYRDAEAAAEHLTRVEGLAPEQIVLYGESLGAAVALELATRRSCAALIAESTFTSLPDMAAEEDVRPLVTSSGSPRRLMRVWRARESSPSRATEPAIISVFTMPARRTRARTRSRTRRRRSVTDPACRSRATSSERGSRRARAGRRWTLVPVSVARSSSEPRLGAYSNSTTSGGSFPS